jgi:hypothetical protein
VKLGNRTVQKLLRELRMPVANMATMRNFESLTTSLHLKSMLERFVHTTEMKKINNNTCSAVGHAVGSTEVGSWGYVCSCFLCDVYRLLCT